MKIFRLLKSTFARTQQLRPTQWASILVWSLCSVSSKAPAELVALLSLDTNGGLSLAVQAVPQSHPALRLQASTNLTDWIDWKWLTAGTGRFVLAQEGITILSGSFFRAQALGWNLTNWSLTLPVDTLRVGTPDEIFQPELATFQDLRYFHTNTAGNGIVFAAPCGGATTKGSQYPRSELREMVNNGLDHASWSTTNGTHSMEVVQAITHLPEVKPQLVAAQIHSATGAVLTVRLQNHDLLIDRQGVKSPLSTNQYQLGDVFGVKLVAHNGLVDCYLNGKFVRSYPIEEKDCYFKAGCYTQSNTNKGDLPTAYGEVVIYGLSVAHK